MKDGGPTRALVRFEALAEPATDRAHRPVGAFAHESWSLCAIDGCSDLALFATLAPASAFAPAGDGAFSLLVARGFAPVARFLERHPKAAVSAEGPLLHVRVGENTLTAGRDLDLTHVELALDETRPNSGERVRGHLVFRLGEGGRGDGERPRPPFPASRPLGPVAGAAEETWSLLAADAMVRGDVIVEDRRGTIRVRAGFEGRGTIDHRAGLTDLRKSLRYAVQSSIHSGDFALVYWKAAPSGSADTRALVVLAERGVPLVAAGVEATAGDRLPDAIDERLEVGGATVRVRHRLDGAVERGPHFLRSRPIVHVDAVIPGRRPIALSGPGLAEVLVPAKLPRSIAGALTATRWRTDRSGEGIEPRRDE